MHTHTSITDSKSGFAARNDLSKDVLALFHFYGVIAIALLFLIVVETHLGMFTGLSGTEALLKATGMDLSLSEIADPQLPDELPARLPVFSQPIFAQQLARGRKRMAPLADRDPYGISPQDFWFEYLPILPRRRYGLGQTEPCAHSGEHGCFTPESGRSLTRSGQPERTTSGHSE